MSQDAKFILGELKKRELEETKVDNSPWMSSYYNAPCADSGGDHFETPEKN